MRSPIRVSIVDRRLVLAQALSIALENSGPFVVLAAHPDRDAWEAASEPGDLTVVSVLGPDDASSIGPIAARAGSGRVIALVAEGDSDLARVAMRLGATE